jgi:hypothetical protein
VASGLCGCFGSVEAGEGRFQVRYKGKDYADGYESGKHHFGLDPWPKSENNRKCLQGLSSDVKRIRMYWTGYRDAVDDMIVAYNGGPEGGSK